MKAIVQDEAGSSEVRSTLILKDNKLVFEEYFSASLSAPCRRNDGQARVMFRLTDMNGIKWGRMPNESSRV